MFIWWSIRLIGCLCVGVIHSQENALELADIEPKQDQTVEVDLTVSDGSVQHVNSTGLGVGQTTEPFACHECTNCTTKSDYRPVVCHSGITMCYKVAKRINNTTRIIRRGCSASKTQCTIPHDDQTHPVESITCCTSHQCNQANQYKPLFFLSIFTFFISLINI